MGNFSDLLAGDGANQRRVQNSDDRWRSAVQVIKADRYFADTAFTVFVAGSMGRSEMGTRSDIDLFVISRRNCDDAEKAQLIEALDSLNAKLGYPPFSNRRFLKVYQLDDLLQKTGSPQDDNENCFTVRMLLLLESRVLANKDTYSLIVEEVLEQYFRDERGKMSYRPLFLLNDVLRYWRTLCLNYEELRHDRARPWWKKNINLKFSRMLTVFATVAALTVHDVHSMADFRPTCDLTPIRRLTLALDSLNDNSLLQGFGRFLLDYEQFLCWKEDETIDATVQEDSFKQSVRASADRLSDFLYSILMNSAIPQTRRKFLVL
jgi:predicted nucleotidyltransferase